MNESIEQRLQAIEQGVEDALALIVRALCRQVRPRQLADDLAELLDGSDELSPPSALCVRLVLRAEQAAEAAMPWGEMRDRIRESSEPE